MLIDFVEECVKPTRDPVLEVDAAERLLVAETLDWVDVAATDGEAENDRVRREGVLEDPVASKLGEPVCVADSDRVAPRSVAVRVAAVCVSEPLALSAVMETDVALIVTVKRVGAALGVADCECSTDAEGESESEAVPVRDGPD